MDFKQSASINRDRNKDIASSELLSDYESWQLEFEKEDPDEKLLFTMIKYYIKTVNINENKENFENLYLYEIINLIIMQRLPIFCLSISISIIEQYGLIFSRFYLKKDVQEAIVTFLAYDNEEIRINVMKLLPSIVYFANLSDQPLYFTLSVSQLNDYNSKNPILNENIVHYCTVYSRIYPKDPLSLEYTEFCIQLFHPNNSSEFLMELSYLVQAFPNVFYSHFNINNIFLDQILPYMNMRDERYSMSPMIKNTLARNITRSLLIIVGHLDEHDFKELMQYICIEDIIYNIQNTVLPKLVVYSLKLLKYLIPKRTSIVSELQDCGINNVLKAEFGKSVKRRKAVIGLISEMLKYGRIDDIECFLSKEFILSLFEILEENSEYLINNTLYCLISMLECMRKHQKFSTFPLFLESSFQSSLDSIESSSSTENAFHLCGIVRSELSHTQGHIQ